MNGTTFINGTNPDNIKKQRHHFVDKGPYSQSHGFFSIMYGCESWTIKKAEFVVWHRVLKAGAL